MANKNLLQSPRGEQPLKAHFIQNTWRKKSAPISKPGLFVNVRDVPNIPENVLEFFKQDPRTRRPFTPAEKIFYAQVFLHEIDEGSRTLMRANKTQDARALVNFDSAMHFVSRLELVRNLTETDEVAMLPPEHIHKSVKARNNQWGAVKVRMGTHHAVAVTECGVGYKEVNEDAFLVIPEHKVMALSDGMGGHVAGHMASGVAVDFFEFAMRQNMSLEDGVSLANDAILLRSRSDPRLGGSHPMGCTFAGVQLKHNLLKMAHVGDTKVLGIREGKIFFETQDHTQGQELLREGLIDIQTAFELNHILNRCLGLDVMRPQRDVTVASAMLKPGDRILMATDGITDNFFDGSFGLQELADWASQGSLMQAADQILHLTENRMRSEKLPSGRPCKRDNLSLALLEFRG